MPMRVIGELHRFVSHGRAMEYVRLGWLPLPSLDGTHHGEFKVHLVWLCSCEAAEPDPLKARQLAMANLRLQKDQQFRRRQLARSFSRR